MCYRRGTIKDSQGVSLSPPFLDLVKGVLKEAQITTSLGDFLEAPDFVLFDVIYLERVEIRSIFNILKLYLKF